MKWNRITPEEAISTLGVNAKPHIIKRLSAGLIDMVILFFTHFGIYSLLMLTPIANTMNGYYNDAIYLAEELKLQSGYGAKEIVDSTYKGSEILHYNEEQQEYYLVKDADFGEDTEAKTAAYQTYTTLLKENEDYSDLTFKYHLHNYVITVFVAGVIVETLFLLVIPLIKNNGQTLGMMIMSIRMYNKKYAGKPHWYQYLGRFAFVFIVESALPYIFIAEWILLAVPGITVLVMLLNKENRALCDFISGIYYVEKKTFQDLDEIELETPEIATENIEKPE